MRQATEAESNHIEMELAVIKVIYIFQQLSNLFKVHESLILFKYQGQYQQNKCQKWQRELGEKFDEFIVRAIVPVIHHKIWILLGLVMYGHQVDSSHRAVDVVLTYTLTSFHHFEKETLRSIFHWPWMHKRPWSGYMGRWVDHGN